MMKTILFLPFLAVLAHAGEAPLIPVKIAVLEALAPQDPTSSETFKQEFQSTLRLGVDLTRVKLTECGYSLDSVFYPFDANDPLQAFEKAKEAEQQGAWMIIGPRRSNHYLLTAKGAPNVPAVSIMASSSEVQELGPRFKTLYPFNQLLAKAAVKVSSELKIAGRRKTYFTVVSDDCISCRDFSNRFDQESIHHKLTKLGQMSVTGDNPATELIVAEILRTKPALVVLPNYSKVSALLMGAINERLPEVRFIGGDGWGDQKFGFLEKNPAAREAPGVTVRGFPPVRQGLEAFPLGRAALAGGRIGNFVPSSGPGLALLKALEGVSNALCEGRSKDREQFLKDFEVRSDRWFTSPWGVSAYEVKGGTIKYWKKVPL